MENEDDHGEKNKTTKKDETVRRKTKGGVLAFGVLGVVCLALFVLGYGSQYRPGGGTTAVRSSIVPVLPADYADRVANNCQQLCASKSNGDCSAGVEQLRAYLRSKPVDETIFVFDDTVVTCKRYCVEEKCPSFASSSCDNIRGTTFAFCMLRNCNYDYYDYVPDTVEIDRCFERDERECSAEATAAECAE